MTKPKNRPTAMEVRPIPAFYACYLLRSSVRHSSLYVGSTPHPARRLAQHNGLTRGGAARTARATLQPWEMVCLIQGFPSSIAALQFEWAWQNPHMTRRIADEERLQQPRMVVKQRKGASPRRRPARPSLSLQARLASLHLLLRSPSFARWPLVTRFLATDVHRQWQKLCDSMSGPQPVSPVLLEADHALTTEEGSSGSSVIQSIDPTYGSLRAHLTKSLAIFQTESTVSCQICQGPISSSSDLAVVCPHEECASISHLSCLASKFLQTSDSQSQVLPLHGQCVKCHHDVAWVDLVREMTLRSRGLSQVNKLLKKCRKGVKKDTPSSDAPAETAQDLVTNAQQLLEVPSSPAEADFTPLETLVSEDEDGEVL